jgi:hypothetical protein
MQRSRKQSGEISRLQKKLSVNLEAFLTAANRTQRKFVDLHNMEIGDFAGAKTIYELIEEEDQRFQEYMRVRHALFRIALDLVKAGTQKRLKSV